MRYATHTGEFERVFETTAPARLPGSPQVPWLVGMAGFLYAVSMHKFAVRDALSSGSGVQGFIEMGTMTGALLCILAAAMRAQRRFPPSLPVICFACFGVLAFCSSWRSFSPPASFVKGALYIVVLSTCYLANQSGLMMSYMRAIYRSYVGLVVLGLVAGVLLPHTYPLFSIDTFSNRMTMSVFDTFFGVVGEDTALFVLIAPLIFERPAWVSGIFLCTVNIFNGGKTSTLLLFALLLIRYTSTVRRWRSWQAVFAVLGIVSLLSVLSIGQLQTHHGNSLLDRGMQAIYGTRVGSEAGGLDGRVDLWKGAIDLLPTVPFIGYGFEGDRALMHKIEPWSGASHNSYLEMALCAGGIGFLCLVTGIVLATRGCLYAPSGMRLHLLAVLAFILIDSVTGGILDNPSFIGLFLLCWLIYAPQRSPQTSLRPIPQRSEKRWSQVSALP